MCCRLGRLNYRLSEACKEDIDTLCSEECSPFLGQACGGRVLRCLTEKQDNIKSKACADEVGVHGIVAFTLNYSVTVECQSPKKIDP